jgi:hypothetical protein
VLKSAQKWSKAARLLYKNGQKLYKSAHNWALFGHFSMVQQYPESVFAPINTDPPPKSAKKFHQIPVFHIPDSRHPFIVLCKPTPNQKNPCRYLKLSLQYSRSYQYGHRMLKNVCFIE